MAAADVYTMPLTVVTGVTESLIERFRRFFGRYAFPSHAEDETLAGEI